METLKIFNVKWTSQSAGPSLDSNRRTEVFLAGCRKAREGNACPGCFNQELWSKDVYCGSNSPQEAFENIRKHAPNKYITFVGGEPLDQAEPLAELCRLLHEDGYHIIVITHFDVVDIMSSAKIIPFMQKLIDNIDVMIDGEYDASLRIWDEEKAGDGLHDVIGSGNQCIVDFKAYHDGYGLFVTEAGKLEGLAMNVNDDMVYVYKKFVNQNVVREAS